MYEIPANVKLAWKRITFNVTFFKLSQKFFFLKEQAHIGQVSDSVLLIPNCMCITHRSSSLSSFTIISGVIGPSYWNRSSCTRRGCRTLSNLVLVAGHLFRQDKKLSSASAINEVRFMKLLLPSLFTAKNFLQLNSLGTQVCTFQANSCWLQPGFVPDRHLLGWALYTMNMFNP